MTLRSWLVAMIAVIQPLHLGAQSLARQITESDGIVQVIYPSRPNACGDGQSFIGNVLGHNEVYSGDVTWSNRNGWTGRQCVHGPARLVVTVINGEVTRARVYVGPVPSSAADVRTITAGATDAVAWMSDVLSRARSRAASDMLLPLVLADAPGPWPLLLRVARDENQPRDLRRNAMLWLSNGVSEHLGLLNAEDKTDDDEMRTQAVFVLSQRPKNESVPQLIELARGAKYPSARKAAIFWLGQSGDARAVDVYAELLGIR